MRLESNEGWYESHEGGVTGESPDAYTDQGRKGSQKGVRQKERILREGRCKRDRFRMNRKLMEE